MANERIPDMYDQARHYDATRDDDGLDGKETCPGCGELYDVAYGKFCDVCGEKFCKACINKCSIPDCNGYVCLQCERADGTCGCTWE